MGKTALYCLNLKKEGGVDGSPEQKVKRSELAGIGIAVGEHGTMQYDKI